MPTFIDTPSGTQMQTMQFPKNKAGFIELPMCRFCLGLSVLWELSRKCGRHFGFISPNRSASKKTGDVYFNEDQLHQPFKSDNVARPLDWTHTRKSDLYVAPCTPLVFSLDPNSNADKPRVKRFMFWIELQKILCQIDSFWEYRIVAKIQDKKPPHALRQLTLWRGLYPELLAWQFPLCMDDPNRITSYFPTQHLLQIQFQRLAPGDNSLDSKAWQTWDI